MPNNTTTRGSDTKQLINQIQWGMRNGGNNGMGAIAAFMGMPFQRKQGGQWMTIDPRRQAIYQTGTTPPPMPQQKPTDTSGNGTNDPNAQTLPGDEFKRNLIPEYWRQWYLSQGQYGGVPPVQGLL